MNEEELKEKRITRGKIELYEVNPKLYECNEWYNKGLQQGKEEMKKEIIKIIKKCKTKAEAPCKISEHSCMDYEDCTDCICDYLIKKVREIK